MSDIPVGSPPAPPGRHAAPGGWYPDPVDGAQERYWDGWQWSRNTRPGSGRGRAAAPPNRGTGPAYAAAERSTLGPNDRAYAPVGQGRPGQAVATADGVPLAGFWWRVLAVLLDQLFTSVVVTVLCFSIYSRMIAAFTAYFQRALDAQRSGAAPPPTPTAADLTTPHDALVLVAVSVTVALLYHVIFLRLRAATPGKLITGLRVVPVDQGHAAGPLPWDTVAIRAAIWVLPGLSGYLSVVRLLDGLLPLWQPRRQALHDLAAKTQVVKIR